MKNCSCGTVLVLLLAVLCLSCQDEEPIALSLSAGQTQNAVLGKWKIQKVDYQLCRSGSCKTTNYTGAPDDYFEFRRDSAFLVHNTANGLKKKEAFKAEYTLPNAFILTHNFWSARYNVKECKPNKMVLECSYVGSDPYAIFTDTYHLYR
ncbi:hypothetical protein H8S95_08700 [Pontibacter sp. KCTC 32443]|uniref:hypothetical protein n=1 Tax=Pontibacter TaxID=323449 RepID=UPI00164DBECC|nr:MULTISPECIES: hypothetical protein [Pontibacter]MBC5774138.1 hypothetical protein [Pontibacter sp. KCTC 32443]